MAKRKSRVEHHPVNIAGELDEGHSELWSRNSVYSYACFTLHGIDPDWEPGGTSWGQVNFYKDRVAGTIKLVIRKRKAPRR